MAGLDKDTPLPTEIKVQQKSRVMDVSFDNGRTFSFSFEFLRVCSPSAEVRGHGPGQETLQVGKRDVDITRVEPVGAYAIKPVFSDGHDSGIYSWDYLYLLGENQDALWADYLARLEAAGSSRDPALVPPPAPTGGGCGHHH
ncbi:gamma-butyrobetaine hydroxylase-like domain-containing protein [Methyloversatilis sp.]|uniref:gamma-butyrobetaine hydroxylase-like domain-containing protein n=1 Tax=Methyloversatilis sp. TaxID=2569862 RepID=UPI0035B321E3